MTESKKSETEEVCSCNCSSKKRIGKTIFLILLCCAAVLFLFRNTITAHIAPRIGSQITGVPVQIGTVKLSPLGRSGGFEEFTLGSPAGFDSAYMTKIKTAFMKIKPFTFLTNQPEIEEISVDSVEKRFEIKNGKLNAAEILKNMQAYFGPSSGQKKNYQIHQASVRNSVIFVDTKNPNESFLVRIASIHGSPSAGKLTIQNFSMIHPLPTSDAEKGKEILAIQQIDIDADPESLIKDTLLIHTLTFKGIVVLVKSGLGGTNLKQALVGFQKIEEMLLPALAAFQTNEKISKTKSKREYKVEQFEMTNAEVQIIFGPIQAPQAFHLPKISFQNISAQSGTSLIQNIAIAIAGTFAGKFGDIGNLFQSTGEILKNSTGTVANTVTDIGKSVGSGTKTVGKAITENAGELLKGLFQRKQTTSTDSTAQENTTQNTTTE